MSQTKETEYQRLVDDFVEQFNDDFNDVISEIGLEGFKARLLESAQNTMPAKERAMLLAQEAPLKIITSLTTTDENKQKAISDYRNQLSKPKEEVDNLLESLEKKQSPSEMERREYADAMFEMHMLMALQEKVDLIAKNMSDPDTARMMANTQHDSRKLVRDIRRNSMNLAKEAAEAKDPATIERISDRLTTLERQVEGNAVRKSQNLSDKVAESDEQLEGNPNPSDEVKVDNAFYHNNQNYFRFSMEGIRDSIDAARKLITEALEKVTQNVNTTLATKSDSSSVNNSPKVQDKQKRGSILGRIREMSQKRASKRDSKADSEATNPFNIIQGNEGRASFKAGEDWKVVDRNASSRHSDESSLNNSATADITPTVAEEYKEWDSAPQYDFIDDDNDAEMFDEDELKDPKIAEKLSAIPEAPPVENKKSTPKRRESPKSRPDSTFIETTKTTAATNKTADPEKPIDAAKSASSSQNAPSFPTGRNPKPSAALMEALARVKEQHQAKNLPSNSFSTSIKK